MTQTTSVYVVQWFMYGVWDDMFSNRDETVVRKHKAWLEEGKIYKYQIIHRTTSIVEVPVED